MTAPVLSRLAETDSTTLALRPPECRCGKENKLTEYLILAAAAF